MLPMIYMALIDDENDKKAFEKLYKKHRNKAFLVAMDCLNNIDLAEECVSEAFLSIAKNFQIVNNLQPNKQHKYIVISIRNTAIDMLKKEKPALDTDEYDYFALRKAPFRTVESTISLYGKHRRTARKALQYGITLYEH